MTDEQSTNDDPNPHYAVIIGFVDANGQLANEAGQQHFNVLINVGEDDDIKLGERVLVFALGPKMIDPTTQESLGHFEIVRGYGKISSVQKKMSIIRSSGTKTVRYQKAAMNALQLLNQTTEEATREEPAPFKDAKLGDLIRFI